MRLVKAALLATALTLAAPAWAADEDRAPILHPRRPARCLPARQLPRRLRRATCAGLGECGRPARRNARGAAARSGAGDALHDARLAASRAGSGHELAPAHHGAAAGRGARPPCSSARRREPARTAGPAAPGRPRRATAPGAAAQHSRRRGGRPARAFAPAFDPRRQAGRGGGVAHHPRRGAFARGADRVPAAHRLGLLSERLRRRGAAARRPRPHRPDRICDPCRMGERPRRLADGRLRACRGLFRHGRREIERHRARRRRPLLGGPRRHRGRPSRARAAAPPQRRAARRDLLRPARAKRARKSASRPPT